MTISLIDPELCNGCGICVEACPVDVIRFDAATERAIIAYAEECMACEWCAQDCPRDAIVVDLAKTGALMTRRG